MAKAAGREFGYRSAGPKNPQELQDTDKYGSVALKFPATLKGKTRPRHFEPWIKPA